MYGTGEREKCLVVVWSREEKFSGDVIWRSFENISTRCDISLIKRAFVDESAEKNSWIYKLTISERIFRGFIVSRKYVAYNENTVKFLGLHRVEVSC